MLNIDSLRKYQKIIDPDFDLNEVVSVHVFAYVIYYKH